MERIRFESVIETAVKSNVLRMSLVSSLLLAALSYSPSLADQKADSKPSSTISREIDAMAEAAVADCLKDDCDNTPSCTGNIFPIGEGICLGLCGTVSCGCPLGGCHQTQGPCEK